jgi:nitrate/nitrite-specific signal transduction histidine kinase
MGLRIMQERVSKLGGKLRITSAPKEGTKVTVTIADNKIPRTNKREKNNE